MTKKSEKIRELKDACNKGKGDLLRIQDLFYDAGLNVQAEQLGRIISRLEGWQNKQ